MPAEHLDGAEPSSSMLQASVVVDELIRCGVREAVLCPGSRNAPLAFALYHADAAHRLRLHVRIDERSAAYLAVGLAARGEAPVPVITTSGTAVANLLPGVLEAGYSGIPLVVISGNRPGEVQGTGASQSIVQPGIFGAVTRAAMVLAQADHHYAPGSSRLSAHNARWRATVCRLISAATGARDGDPGPVHLDIPFAEPLIGPGTCPTLPGRPGQEPWTRITPSSLDAPVTVDLRPDTLVIAGQGAPVFPELAGMPTVAEPAAPPPQFPVHPLALPQLHPEQVIVLGRPTLHRSVSRLLAAPSVLIVVVARERAWTDVAGTAGIAARTIRTTGAPSTSWLDICRAASDTAHTAVDRVLDDTHISTGLHVARAVTRQLRDGDTLVLGSSNPVRDVSIAWRRTTGVRVVANRGVAGIDGLVSLSMGAALAGGGRTVALLGDLTFAHDSGGLLVGPSEPVPHDLSIVVANDDGGGIFGLLEQGAPQFTDMFERVFGTPHGTDIAQLCSAHNVAHVSTDVAELGEVLGRGAATAGGLRVVEVRTSRTGLRELHTAIRAEVEMGTFDDLSNRATVTTE
jgi:2-succinyl-5-enolpyruvyl-6-hydroxy-3-cyclohexene-1-carboxylate synthase